MCGIVGVVGARGAARLVYEGLRRLEYRGYDSCGYCLVRDRRLELVKTVGGVAQLSPPPGGDETLALGHTRWATHGGVTMANAHPHTDCANRIAVVHNGIIENHGELRSRLEAAGHAFRSQTDSEVVPHLLEEHAELPLVDALRRVLGEIRGSYALAALRVGESAIAFAKNRTPLVVGVGRDGHLLASDPNALAAMTDELVYVGDGTCGEITADRIVLWEPDGRPRPAERVKLEWRAEESERAGFPHYMLKEIHETPQVLNRVLSGRVHYGPPYVRLELEDDFLRPVRRVTLLGAGTSYHACLIGANYIRRIAGIPAQAELAPEYKDVTTVEAPGTLVVAVSQSGETLDTLEAVGRIRGQGPPILAITNSPHSALARGADASLLLNAGPEVGVAATKTFLAQVVLLLLVALRLARVRGRIGDAELAGFAHGLKEMPRVFARLLLRPRGLEAAGRFLAKYTHSFVLGKGLNLHAAQEGALKLKEIAYQHAEAYAAGELKHGAFALLTPETPVVVLLPPSGSVDKLLNNVMQVKARGSPLVLLTSGSVPGTDGLADHLVALPEVPELLEPLLFANALHLLAYETAKQRGCEIDRPRNLAKSVTVE